MLQAERTVRELPMHSTKVSRLERKKKKEKTIWWGGV
jgi:hypothetical protein